MDRPHRVTMISTCQRAPAEYCPGSGTTREAPFSGTASSSSTGLSDHLQSRVPGRRSMPVSHRERLKSSTAEAPPTRPFSEAMCKLRSRQSRPNRCSILSVLCARHLRLRGSRVEDRGVKRLGPVRVKCLDLAQGAAQERAKHDATEMRFRAFFAVMAVFLSAAVASRYRTAGVSAVFRGGISCPVQAIVPLSLKGRSHFEQMPCSPTRQGMHPSTAYTHG